jgi:plastocyanin
MRDPKPFVATLVLSCGLFAVAACGDDPSSDGPAVDSGASQSADAAAVDASAGHDHTNDAAVSDASSSAADAGANATCTASISLQDFKLVPEKPTAKAGTIVLCAKNDGKAPHDLGVRGADMSTLDKTKTLGPGESASITLTLTAGSFAIYCSQAGHESLGMKGTLLVE